MNVSGKVVRIDHVQLAMPKGSEDRARSFYRDVLGMNELPKPESLADPFGNRLELIEAKKRLSQVFSSFKE